MDRVGGVSPTHRPIEVPGESPELLARVVRPGYMAACLNSSWAKEADLDLWHSQPRVF